MPIPSVLQRYIEETVMAKKSIQHEEGNKIEDLYYADMAMPIDVEILTKDYEVTGVVYVSREVKEKRRITELLNDPERRFLAITDARMTSRKGTSTARTYSFLSIHIDSILMIHPSVQSKIKTVNYSNEDDDRLNRFRDKLNQPPIAKTE